MNFISAALNFGEPCEQLSQCNKHLIGSICENNTCQCSLGHHANGNTCYKSVNKGGICNNDKECQIKSDYVSFIGCEKNICTCVENSRNTLSECAPRSNSSQGKLLIFNFIILLCSIILRVFV